jgi:hypothetical protein
VSDLTAFEGVPFATLLAEMFMVSPPSMYCTIGSSVQSLETSIAVFPTVMDALAQNDRTLRLGTLHFTTAPAGHQIDAFRNAFRRNLPKLLYLKELTIGVKKDDASFPYGMGNVLKTLRTSGSVVRLVLCNVNFTARIQELWDAYLQRNESIPFLLADPPSRSGKKHVERGPDKNADGPLDLSLFPSLFEVSKSMPAMSANLMLVGLLAAAGNSNIGPTSLDGKRAGFSDISNR